MGEFDSPSARVAAVTSYFSPRATPRPATTPQAIESAIQSRASPESDRHGAKDWRMEDVSNVLCLSTETVAIRVHGAQYAVNKGLLCHFSSYYRAALSGSFRESSEGLEMVEYLSKDIFAVFVAWLHSGMVPAGPPSRAALGDLIRLYVYADEYDIPAFRRTLLIQLYDLLEPCRHAGLPRSGPRAVLLPSNAQVEFVCDRLPSNAPLVRLIVEAFACYWHPRMDLGFDDSISAPPTPGTPPNHPLVQRSHCPAHAHLQHPYYAVRPQIQIQKRDSLPSTFLGAVMARQAELREEPKIRCQYGCPPGYRIQLSRLVEFEGGRTPGPQVYSTAPVIQKRTDSPMGNCTPAATP